MSKTCDVPGCERTMRAKGYCSSHWQKWRAYGDPLGNGGDKPNLPRCSLPECEKPAFQKGWCSTHYARWRKHGDPHITKAKRGRSPCIIEGCEKPNVGHGLCGMHWTRRKKHGDPLKVAVATLPGEAREYLEGIVLAYDGDQCLIWPYHRNKFGYGTISEGGRPHIASRIVCQAVHGDPPGPGFYAAHSCGNGKGGCVNPKHLAWKTRLENEADKEEHGTRLRGERSPVSKLTVRQVQSIKALRGKTSQQDLAARFGVARQTVGDIQNGRRWSFVDAANMEPPK